MVFSIWKCCMFNLFIFLCTVAIVTGESKKKGVTDETPKEMEEMLENSKKPLDVTEAAPSEMEKSPKEEIEELEKLEKEAEAEQAANAKKELAEIELALTEASADLAELEKAEKELETESPKEKQEEEEEKKPDEKSGTSAEEAEVSTSNIETTDSEEKSEIKTSASPMLATVTSIEKEEAPKDTFAVWNSKGKICLLAKFNAIFTIIYASKGGEQKAEVTLPQDGNVKGKCETNTRTPLIQISWQKYVFSMMFNKTAEDNWVVTSMDLTYDTSEGLYDRATNAGKKTASSKVLSLFETPMKKSHFCPAQEVVLLYSANKQVVTAKLKDVYLQPYEVEEAKFSPAHRCNKVVLDGSESFVQDETVPLAVGLTLALITLFILVGFSVHRAYNAAKVDYNTME